MGTKTGLQEARQRFFKELPAAETLDQALRTTRNPDPLFFMAPVSGETDLKGSGFALLRLGHDLERRFGINGEVAAYFIPWQDFQRRSFNAITLRTNSLSRTLQKRHLRSERFTPSRRVALLVSTDPNIEAKLDEWQNDSHSEMTVVAIDAFGSAGDELLREIASSLRSRLGERDLYRTQNPVSGPDFFGRTRLLRDLGAAIGADQNIAVLGLRRSGKTSVLQELRRMLLPQSTIMPIADFQMLEDNSVEELASSIAASLTEELKILKQSGVDVWIGGIQDQVVEGLSPTAMSDRIKRVASRNPHIRVVVAVDEVESAAAIARTNPNSIKVLLGALRSAAQARANVSLVFSGVANRMFRNSSLDENGSVDNPMFNQVSPVYLTSFSLEETSALLSSLGTPMLLNWEDDAVEEVQRITGGFPYFVRDLASNVRKTVHSNTPHASSDTVQITAEHVRESASGWSVEAAEAWLGIVKALNNHYPSAATLLDERLTEDELNEWVQGDEDARSASEDLIALDLFRREEENITRSPALSALQTLITHMSPIPPSELQSDGDPTIDQLVEQGESHTVEFKETSRINIRTGSKDKAIEDSIVKTVAAFLNSAGGELLIGISDDGLAKGLDPDLGLFGGSEDRFERWLRGDLLASRIDKHIVADQLRTGISRFRGKNVMRVTVEPSNAAVWVDDKRLFRRLGNQTIEITSGRELQQFLAQRP